MQQITVHDLVSCDILLQLQSDFLVGNWPKSTLCAEFVFRSCCPVLLFLIIADVSLFLVFIDGFII